MGLVVGGPGSAAHGELDVRVDEVQRLLDRAPGASSGGRTSSAGRPIEGRDGIR